MPTALELIGLAVQEGAPYLVQMAKERMQISEFERTQAIQKESFAKMRAVLAEEGRGTAQVMAEMPAAEPECATCGIHSKMKDARKVVGNRTWILLHATVDSLPDDIPPESMKRVKAFVDGIFHAFPCPPCAKDMAEYLREHPLDYSSKKSLQRSLCKTHNALRTRLGQPITHTCK
jgi:hypothetical protein